MVTHLQAQAASMAGVFPPEDVPLAIHFLEHEQRRRMSELEYQQRFPCHCWRLSQMLASSEARQ